VFEAIVGEICKIMKNDTNGVLLGKHMFVSNMVDCEFWTEYCFGGYRYRSTVIEPAV
jgi:hypothetical protein